MSPYQLEAKDARLLASILVFTFSSSREDKEREKDGETEGEN